MMKVGSCTAPLPTKSCVHRQNRVGKGGAEQWAWATLTRSTVLILRLILGLITRKGKGGA